MNVAPHFPLNVHVEHLWTTPLWVAELISQVLRDYGYTRTVCLYWRRSQRNKFSTGHVDYSNPAAPRIAITAGSILVDHRHVALHELAHLITGEGHTRGMYQVAWDLYRKYDRRNLAHAAVREALYRSTAFRATNAPSRIWLLKAWRRWPYRGDIRDTSRDVMDTLADAMLSRPRRARKKVSKDG